jgi:cephalosporin hydroxylase
MEPNGRDASGSQPSLGGTNRDPVGEAFCRRYLESGVWMWTTWMGTRAAKCPLDLWIYQELLWRTRPDVIVETGTFMGGSALFLASMCDLIGTGRVITVDIEDRPNRPSHPRISYLAGSSIDPEVLARVRSEIAVGETVMVVLDSDHTKEHVLAELHAYAPLVSPGNYLVAEDTAAARIVPPVPDEGPIEAVATFLADNHDFAVDEGCEKFLMSWHPGGYLKRREPEPTGPVEVPATDRGSGR